MKEQRERGYTMKWKRTALTVLLVPMGLATLITLGGCFFRSYDGGHDGGWDGQRDDTERHDNRRDGDSRGGDRGDRGDRGGR